MENIFIESLQGLGIRKSTDPVADLYKLLEGKTLTRHLVKAIPPSFTYLRLSKLEYDCWYQAPPQDRDVVIFEPLQLDIDDQITVNFQDPTRLFTVKNRWPSALIRYSIKEPGDISFEPEELAAFGLSYHLEEKIELDKFGYKIKPKREEVEKSKMEISFTMRHLRCRSKYEKFGLLDLPYYHAIVTRLNISDELINRDSLSFFYQILREEYGEYLQNSISSLEKKLKKEKARFREMEK